MRRFRRRTTGVKSIHTARAAQRDGGRERRPHQPNDNRGFQVPDGLGEAEHATTYKTPGGTGGTVGTALRAVLEGVAPASAHEMPWTTLAINVLGSFALGLLLEVLLRTGIDSGWRRTMRLGLGTGVLGGFTTYSTFAAETVERLTLQAHLIT